MKVRLFIRALLANQRSVRAGPVHGRMVRRQTQGRSPWSDSCRVVISAPQQHCAYLKRRAPFVLQNVQANPP